MKQLRKKIFGYFILCAFFLQLATSALDSIVDTFIMPHFEKAMEASQEDPVTGSFVFMVIIFFVLTLSLFALAAFIFYRLVKKAVAKESQKQAEEQRLMYASLAHDLKTPLTSVVGFSSSLIDKKIPPEKQDEITQTIHDKAVQMNTLLEAMLSYSKLGSANYELHTEKTDFCNFIKTVAANFYNDFEAHNMNLEVEIPESAIFAELDKTEFSRAAGNLLSNAISHNPKGTNILIKITEEKKHIRLIIADTGTPIEKSTAKNLFTPFVSGDKARTAGKNSGLGLAITNKIVQLHGGKLYIDFDIPDYTKAFVMEVSKCKEN